MLGDMMASTIAQQFKPQIFTHDLQQKFTALFFYTCLETLALANLMNKRRQKTLTESRQVT